MLLKIVVRRILQVIPVLIGVSFATFILLNLLPGDAALAILGQNATPKGLALLRRQLGLSTPILERYWDWFSGALRGDLGRSILTHESAATMIMQRVPVTLELLILSFLIAIVLAVVTSMLAVRKPGKLLDWCVSFVTMLGLSIPNFVLALVLILIFAVKLQVLPATGYTPLGSGIGANLESLALPSLSMSYLLFASYVRVLRADMLEQMVNEDYVLVAQAKGLGDWLVIIKHVLRNSCLNLVTLVGVNFGTLLGSTVVVETIFALPGMGQLLLSSIDNRDVPVVQGLVLVMALLVVVANLLADIVHSIIDPRTRVVHAS